MMPRICEVAVSRSRDSLSSRVSSAIFFLSLIRGAAVGAVALPFCAASSSGGLFDQLSPNPPNGLGAGGMLAHRWVPAHPRTVETRRDWVGCRGRWLRRVGLALIMEYYPR